MMKFWDWGAFAVAGVLLSGCDTPTADPLPPPARATIARMAPTLADTEFGGQARRALLAHPALSAGGARIEAALAGVTAARSAAIPRLSLGADVGTNLLNGGASTPGFLVLQVSQLLFDAGATRNRIRAAEASAIRETIERENTAAALALNLAEAWAELRFQRLLLDAAKENHTEHRRYLSQIEARLSAGAGTEADLAIGRSRTADAATREITTQGQVERAEARFTELYGTSAARLPELPRAPGVANTSDAALVAASPRIRSLEAEIAAARASAEAVRAGRLPVFDLRVEAAYNPRDDDLRSTAGLNPRVSLGPGGEREANIARTAARVVELEAERSDVERQIVRALAFLRSDQRSGAARLAAAQAALDANVESVRVAAQQYTIGRRSLIQLLDAQRDLYLATETFALAQRDAALSGYAALALTGDILDVLGVVLPQRNITGQGKT